MSRVLFLLLSITSFSYPVETASLEQLDYLLTSINELEGHGPIESLYGLEAYLAAIEQVTLQPIISIEDAQFVKNLLSKLFSRFAYRDGSHRSRIFAQAHIKSILLLSATAQGTALLDQAEKDCPIIQLYRSILPSTY